MGQVLRPTPYTPHPTPRPNGAGDGDEISRRSFAIIRSEANLNSLSPDNEQGLLKKPQCRISGLYL
ncbi:MAG: hypothetical protein KME31_22675 [Tolypothrix carrinoi HA7290-LM1]|nr:hypothetical protein [Tolypothrix carrinoi HA7290-LM1]